MTVSTDIVFFLCALVIGFIGKSFIVFDLLKNHIKTNSRLYLLLFIIGALYVDVSWFTQLIHYYFYPLNNVLFLFFGVRLLWAYTVVMYHGLALFIESLVQKSGRLIMKNPLLLGSSALLCLFFVGLSFYYINDKVDETQAYLRQFRIVYEQLLLVIATLLVMVKLKTMHDAEHYANQIKFGVIPLLCIFIILNMLWAFPFNFAKTHYYYGTCLLYTTAMLYYFSKVLSSKEELNIS